MSSTHESFLVLRAQGGSRPALEALLRAVQAPLYGYLRGVVGDEALAEDVLQDVLVQVSRKLGWLRDPRLFRAWVFRIATRRALRVLRAEQTWRERLEPEAEPDALPAPAEAETPDAFDLARERLPALLAALPPATRAAVSLHYLRELTIQETAEALGVPVGTAKSRINYGLSALRRALVPRPASLATPEVP